MMHVNDSCPSSEKNTEHMPSDIMIYKPSIAKDLPQVSSTQEAYPTDAETSDMYTIENAGLQIEGTGRKVQYNNNLSNKISTIGEEDPINDQAMLMINMDELSIAKDLPQESSTQEAHPTDAETLNMYTIENAALPIDDTGTQVQDNNNLSNISNIIGEEDQLTDQEMMMIDMDELIAAQIVQDPSPDEIIKGMVVAMTYEVNQAGDVHCISSGKEYHRTPSNNHQIAPSQIDETEIKVDDINNVSNIITVNDHELLVQDLGTDRGIDTSTHEGHVSDELTPSTPPTQKSRKRIARPQLWKKNQRKA